MFELPTSVVIEDETIKIRNQGDYRVILDCFSALQDAELDETERVITALIIFYEGVDSPDNIMNLKDIKKAVTEMYRFFNCGKEECELGTKTNHKLVDWEKDEQLIASAINSVANTEVRLVPYIHWWTFMGYYTAVGECPLSNIISIRYKIVSGKKLEKHEQEFKRENPQYFVWNAKTVEQSEADQLARELWNSNS